MKPNNLIKATLAAGLTAGLAFSPIIASAAPPAGPGPGEGGATPPTGQHGFFVDGLKPLFGSATVSDTEYQNYVHPDLPFPIHTVQWPRVAFPFNGFSTLDASVARGVANTIASIKENAAVHNEFGDFVHLTCYGAGCVVIHKVKPAFEEGGELEDYLLYEVTTFRDPANADGGILTKLPFNLPGFTRVNQDNYQDATVEQTITYRYDLVSDAPDKPGLLAFANAIAAAIYYGDDYGYDQLTDAISDGRVVMTVQTGDNGSGRTHYLVDDPDRGLPLTKLFRDIGLALNNSAGDVKVHQFWDKIDSWLKPHIDSKYDTGPNPEVNQREVSTSNGVPFELPTGNEDEQSPDENVDEGAEQSSFNASVDNQVANRGAAVDNEPAQDDDKKVVDQSASMQVVPTGNETGSDDSTQGAVTGDPGNSTQANAGDQPVKKTWKERRAERKAEREAKKAERKAEREAKKAERQQRKEEQAVETTVNDDQGSDDGNNDNDGGGDNGSDGGTGDGGSES